MQDVLIRAACFVAVIVLGYVLRRVGFFDEHAFPMLVRISLRITLPASVIYSFSDKQIDPSLLLLALLGLGGGALYMAIGWLMGRRRGRQQSAFHLLNLSGYNIGSFAMPFAQSFLEPIGVIATSIFDVGNAVVALGGAYSVANAVQDGGKFSVRRILRTMVRSVPFMTYVIMLILTLCQLRLPGPVVSLAKLIGDANPFVAMLMLGVGFRVEADRSQLWQIVRLLLVRYGVAAAVACGFYFLLPFEAAVRQALVILCFSPIASAVPGFTQELGGDAGLSSAVNSLSILCSVPIIVALLTVML